MEDHTRICHDLAVAYAKSKLDVELAAGLIGKNAQEPIEAAHKLAGWYSECMYELCQFYPDFISPWDTEGIVQ